MSNTMRSENKAHQMRSIRWPLIVAIIAALMIPALLSSAFVAVMGFDATKTQVANQLESVVTLKSAQIDLWLEDVQHDLAALASDSETRGWLTHVLPDSTLKALSRDAGIWLKGRFNDYMRQSQNFTSLFVLDLSGNLLISSDFNLAQLQELLGNPAVQPTYEKPFEGLVNIEEAAASPTILPVEYDAATGPRLTILQPITNVNLQTIALLGGYVDLERLNAVTNERAGLGDTGETLLIDSHNRLLTESRFPESYPVGETIIDTETIRMQGADNDVPFYQYPNYRNENVIGFHRLLPRLGLTMLTEIEASEALRPIVNVLTLNSLMGIATVIAISLAGIWFINRRIINPLSQLRESASKIAHGALDIRVNIATKDEFGLLAETFNAMTIRLGQMVEAERLAKTRLETIVSDYVAFVQRVADGDLTSRLDLKTLDTSLLEGTTEDMFILGETLNRMVENLRSMAHQIHTVSEEIVLAASDIQVAAMLQSNSATEQDVAVTQTVATVEEVRSTVEQTAERAQQVADTSQQSVEVSRMGQQAVAENVDGMNMIRQRVESIARSILDLSERTQQIGEIIDTVNALADQSKLLSLNASIEAARAGEEGKGFAVVAMEVRQLAEQSREATARVRDIIDEIRDTTNAAVMVTEEGSKGAAEGVGLVERAGNAIRDLAAAIEESAQAATQIAASTHQQTNGMNQLAAAMMQIKESSEQTAQTTQQAEKSVQHLMTMAEQLEAAAARYRL